jgi:hypothetical protein
MNGQRHPFAARNHYIPHDYWRLTPASITRLLQEAHFADIAVVPRGSDVAVAMHKINSLFYRIIFRNIPHRILRRANRLFFSILFAAPIVLLTLVGHLSILLKAGSPDDPLGYTVYCRKIASCTPMPGTGILNPDVVRRSDHKKTAVADPNDTD